MSSSVNTEDLRTYLRKQIRFWEEMLLLCERKQQRRDIWIRINTLEWVAKDVLGDPIDDR